ncbi:D-alanyl-D-alanine carboxypeptidase [Patescibacteria group bacterium]|nr:D-alanyl-D-alanine carboxypeptidase [Patescibacteria group bacterium]
MKVRFLLGLLCLLPTWFVPEAAFGAGKALNWEPFLPADNEFAAAVVMLPKTHQMLYSFKPNKAHTAASLTKLPSAMVFLKNPGAWERLITLSKVDEVGGGRLRVNVGTKIPLRDLFYASITASANNAAMALVRAAGVSMKTYLVRMNQTVKALGANNSTFYDASGMDARNTTTAHDMALIAEAAFRTPEIRRAATVETYPVRIASAGQVRTIKNTNPLLAPGTGVWVMGGKTGYLEESMYNFVGQFRPERADGSPELGKDVIVVVLGAPTKEAQFQTAKRLAQWAWNTHEF